MTIRRISSHAASTDTQGQKETHPQKHHAHAVSKEIDTGAWIVVGLSAELDPLEAARVRRKIDYHILPMMCILYWIQFMDKTTLGAASILGIIRDTHLTTNEYNWLGTIFYISYFVFEYPQNLALQRFPVGKWMSLNIFVWAISLTCQAACTNFTGLFVCRFFLGMCEGSITAGFLLVTSMFYTRKEQTLRVGYWLSMNGISIIITSFVSFGTLHIETTRLAPWQWLMIICGGMTLIVAIIYWLFFPDSPTNAWFLTPTERVTAVRRLKENQTGVENKHFKKEQVIEALRDPKTWLFALFFVLIDVPNSFTNQGAMVIASFGFTYLDTTLLGCVGGVILVIAIWTAVTLAARIPNSRAYIAVMSFIPSIAAVLLLELLPRNDRVGLLLAIYLFGISTPGFVLALSWLTSVTAGHTKRVTTNAIILSAYCIGNAAGPFMWQAQYKPRNRIPWMIIGICQLACPFLLLFIRWTLARENARRDTKPVKEDEEVLVEKETGDGTVIRVKVDKEFLDLTDRQNRDFRYVL